MHLSSEKWGGRKQVYELGGKRKKEIKKERRRERKKEWRTERKKERIMNLEEIKWGELIERWGEGKRKNRNMCL